MKEGQSVEFRVRAENRYGVGEPLENNDGGFTPKSPYDRPGAPGKPEALDTTDDSITIQWTKPLKDGGAAISGYIVEKREVDGDGGWVKATYNNVIDTRLKITGLTPKKQYEFRVCAVNVAGPGMLTDNR